VDVSVLQNEKLKVLKLEIPVAKADKFIGQIAYGTETFPRDGSEECPHRFVAVTDGDDALAVFNDCIYGTSCEKNKLRLTLLNGSAYCAHPILDRPVLDETRYNEYIENGLHYFRFRLAVKKIEELEKMATEFTQQPYALNHFPHGTNKETALPVKCLVENKNVVMSVLRARGNGEYVLRLFNNTDRNQQTSLRLENINKLIKLKKYEVKTFLYKDGVLTEKAQMII
jgi:alpha-mannosidase